MSNYDPNQPGQPYDPNAGSNASNPYGQNPYGQQPAPYGQNPYGQQPGQPPAFDPYAQQQGGYAAVPPPAERPQTLQWAFLLILAAGVISAVANWLVFQSDLFMNMFSSQWSAIKDEFDRQMASTPGASEDPMIQQMMSSPEAFVNEIHSTLAGFMVVSLVISVGLYFLVGFFVGRGVNAMRVVATILAVLSVMGVASTLAAIATFGGGQAGLLIALTLLGVICGVAGVVFSWLRPSSEYIIARRRARMAGYR
ncbi:hypothetical protein AUR04nite_08700 [Glutamicibacter uratoxydans]|uniref:Uncharacterized protein n=1 Tax=Glutamicibacter uratoxydans TaxID=43667 RepID=A0A4Y4DPN5_GLUUR|nr:hypothetical protein [Glutamicibacter uratoxydans]GED05338.1 hypothetical protein AUR04nite_08700 [Glutamicibacter uratoxydans]